MKKIHFKFISVLTIILLLLLLNYWMKIIISRTYKKGDENILKFEKNDEDIIEFDDNFDNEHNGSSVQIVPNIVHYIFFDNCTIHFIAYLSILSVLKFHKPNKIFIHSNMDQCEGYYWDKIMAIQNLFHTQIKMHYLMRPTHVYGQLLGSVYHASDVGRIQVLKMWGGIYLDNDMCVLKSLEKFLHFEFTLGWPENEFLGTQILIGNKNARFLKYWLECYRNYQPRRWYYNAGELPTRIVLEKHPQLVHRVKENLGVKFIINLNMLGNWSDWRNYYAIHTFRRHINGMRDYNEQTVKNLQTPFGEIARKILYT